MNGNCFSNLAWEAVLILLGNLRYELRNAVFILVVVVHPVFDDVGLLAEIPCVSIMFPCSFWKWPTCLTNIDSYPPLMGGIGHALLPSLEALLMVFLWAGSVALHLGFWIAQTTAGLIEDSCCSTILCLSLTAHHARLALFSATETNYLPSYYSRPRNL